MAVNVQLPMHLSATASAAAAAQQGFHLVVTCERDLPSVFPPLGLPSLTRICDSDYIALLQHSLLLQVTAKKDHKLEETGMFEQTLSFRPQPALAAGVTEVVQHWPIVSARSTKTRFTREQDEYYQGGSK
jgi:hypothetical protein